MSGTVGEVVVEVLRGEHVESRHRVSVAVVDAHGQLRAWAGDPRMITFARSAIKPFQALPLVADGAADAFDLNASELAVCCASHSGEARHVAAVGSILRKIGADEEALACGPHAPFHELSARVLREAGEKPRRIHNNCSGKHAGMLALARHHGWPLAGYHLPGHPVQQRVTRELSQWTDVGEDDLLFATDGCGVVTFAAPLDRFALGFARLAAAARKGAADASRIVSAMVRYPEYVAGTDRLCTTLMRAASGRIFAKVGAEGVYMAGVPGAELGVALKVEDGAQRAAEPALVAVLNKLSLLTGEEMAGLERYAEPRLKNTRGEEIGVIQSHVKLATDHG